MPTITNISKSGFANVVADVDGIHFSSISTLGGEHSALTVRGNNPWNYNGTGVWSPAVNAVDIDWNTAQLGDGKEIKSTGDMLSYVSGVAALAHQIEEILIGL